MTKEETNTNDIDLLLRFLDENGWEWHHAALTALIADRDKAKADFSHAWRERSEFAKRIDEADAALAAALEERDEYRSRYKAQREDMADMVGKKREADRDLRERLVCAALTGLCAAQKVPCAALCQSAVATADATLDSFRREQLWIDGEIGMKEANTDA